MCLPTITYCLPIEKIASGRAQIEPNILAGQLLCYVSNEFSSCAAGDRVSLLSGAPHNRRAWNDNYVKGFVKN